MDISRQANSGHAFAQLELFPLGRRTHHILIVDDNVQLRSVLARHFMLVCRELNYSCALFHVTERAETHLTFFDPADLNFTANPELDFAVYEANSPRQALKWLRQASLRRLAIVSDVMMPIDTEVGLDGFLDGLAELELPVGLLFVSSEAQSLTLVEQLMAPQPAYFVTKGGPNWATLPQAMVRNIETLQYRPVRPNPKRAVAKPSQDTYLVKLPSRNYVLEVKFPVGGSGSVGNSGGPRSQILAQGFSKPKIGWWARLRHWLVG